MSVSQYSRNHFLRAAANWEVPRDYAEPVADYFLNGFNPGSFFSALLANDMAGAVAHSHPANSMQGLKNLFGWLDQTRTRGVAWGDKTIVDRWLRLDNHKRRGILEAYNLVFTERVEILKALNGEDASKPEFVLF